MRINLSLEFVFFLIVKITILGFYLTFLNRSNGPMIWLFLAFFKMQFGFKHAQKSGNPVFHHFKVDYLSYLPKMWQKLQKLHQFGCMLSVQLHE